MIHAPTWAPRPNIIMIVPDSLPYANAVQGGQLVGMPNTLTQASYFANAHAAGCWTAASHASMFSGLLPHQHRVTAKTRDLPDDVTVLAQVLQGLGYQTHQITANGATAELFGLDRGFEKVEAVWKTAPKRSGIASRAAFAARFKKHMLPSAVQAFNPWAGQKQKDSASNRMSEDIEAVTAWMQSNVDYQFEQAKTLLKSDPKTPKLIYINLMETHFPYHVADEFSLWDRFSEIASLQNMVRQTFLTQREETINSTMRQVLQQRQKQSWERLAPKIDAFLQELDSYGDNFAVVTADHGENFGHENNWLYHFHNVTSEGTRVPLLIRDVENRRQARTFDDPVSTRLLFSTILRAVGAEIFGSEANDLMRSDLKGFTPPEMSAMCYDNGGKTLPEYHYNQYAFIYEGRLRFIYRKGQWYVTGVLGETMEFGEHSFFPTPIVGNPVEDLPLPIEHRRALKKSFEEFLKFSEKIGEGPEEKAARV